MPPSSSSKVTSKSTPRFHQNNNKSNSSSTVCPQNPCSMSMDDLLSTMYGSTVPTTETTPPPVPVPVPQSADAYRSHPHFSGASISREGSYSLSNEVVDKSADEAFRRIVSGDRKYSGSSVVPHAQALGHSADEITLEDFLTKAGAMMRVEDARVGGRIVQVGMYPGVYGRLHAGINGRQFQAFGANRGGAVEYQGIVGSTGGVRVTRKAVEEPPSVQKKLKRMIKNRESAARSRERKQAYTVQLETLATQLEEENARLSRELVERNMERFNELMESAGPANKEKRRQQCKALRKVKSLSW